MLDQLRESRNQLFASLRPDDLHRLRPAMEVILCARDQVLVDTDEVLNRIYFPETSVISLAAVFSDGAMVGMATIGREGCTGVQVVLGSKASSARLVTQIPGTALRMSRRAFVWAMDSVPSFKAAIYGYAESFLEQTLISGACNAAHRLNQRLARWLLTTRDRSDHDTLPVTQAQLAEILGVQRPTMTNALGEFERAGLIAGARRQITILNRQGLAEESCECYDRLHGRFAGLSSKRHVMG